MGAPNKPFRSLVKGSKVKPGEKEVEFKIAPKPKEEPKIDPALEITPSTEKKKVEEPLSEYQIVTPDPKETGKTPESKPNAKAKKKIKSSDKLEELTD